jgi:hypothetical protein
MHRPRKLLISYLFFGVGHSRMVFSISGLVINPSGDTLWPRHRTSFWKSWHFYRLSFRQDCQKHWNTLRGLSRCSWNVWPVRITSRTAVLCCYYAGRHSTDQIMCVLIPYYLITAHSCSHPIKIIENSLQSGYINYVNPYIFVPS